MYPKDENVNKNVDIAPMSPSCNFSFLLRIIEQNKVPTIEKIIKITLDIYICTYTYSR